MLEPNVCHIENDICNVCLSGIFVQIFLKYHIDINSVVIRSVWQLAIVWSKIDGVSRHQWVKRLRIPDLDHLIMQSGSDILIDKNTKAFVILWI